MERRIPLLVVVAAFLLLAAAPASGDPGDEKDRVDARLGDARARLADAQAAEGVLTTELSTLGDRARQAAAAVAVEQARLEVLEAELAGQQALRARIERDLAERVERLRIARHEEVVAVDRLEQRARQLYMSDDPDAVSLLLGATSFEELVDNVDLLNRIGRQDRRLAKEARAARAEAVAAEARVRGARRRALATERLIADRTRRQRAARDRLAVTRDEADAAERAKRSALGDIRATEVRLHEQVEALEAESAALAAAIRAASTAGSVTSGTPSASGLVWPVSGPVTSGFGTRWGRMHEGIDIAVPEGTAVAASASGTVIYAGWLGGYGNLVVVDHGGGLATAYGHNSGFAVAVGQHVDQGATIAYSGNTGNSTGPHVHFEVRVGGGAVDPLGYL